MKNILTKRYYLSDFMYDSYNDEPTNLYDGFFVDLIPDIKHPGYTEFWLGHEAYSCKDGMFIIADRECATEFDIQVVISKNVGDYIEEFVDSYFNEDCCDCECCDGCCEEDELEIDGSLLEAIDMHNDHVDKMQDLAQVLMDNIPNVDGSEIDKAFGEAFDSLIGNAIYLCCSANSYGCGKWMTTGDWHVIEDVEGE